MRNLSLARLGLPVCLCVSWFLTACAAFARTPLQPEPKTGTQPAQHLPISILQTLPMQFEENKGQADKQTRFLARGASYTLLLGQDGLRLVFRHRPPVSMEFVAARSGTISGLDPLSTATNYYLGSDPAGWRLGVQSYRSVNYSKIYKGIDLLYHGNGQELEYDFAVAPRADPSQIRIRFSGFTPVIEGEDLTFAGIHQLRIKGLRAFQWIQGKKEAVEASWRVHGDQASIQLGAYDRERELIIDPVFFYGTYIGGAENDAAVSIVPANQAGYFFVALSTSSPQINDPPAQGNDSPAANPNPLPGTDTLILGIDASAAPAPPSPLPPFGMVLTSNYPQLVVNSVTSQTYLGGTTGKTEPTGMVGDSNGNLYIAGTTTNGASFTPSTSQPCLPACTGFVAKFAASINAATHTATIAPAYAFGLPATPNAIAVDTTGNAYLTGSAYATAGKPMLTVPATDKAFQSVTAAPIAGNVNPHAFLLELDPAGATLFCSYLGGSGTDQGNAIAISDQTVVVAGQTSSADFPRTPGVYQGSNAGGDQDGFVLSAGDLASAPTLNFATYLGGSATDTVASIAFNPMGDLILTGSTNSTLFPTQKSPFTMLLWPTLNPQDSMGNVTAQLPTAAPTVLTLPIAPVQGVQAAFVTRLSADGAHLVFTDFLGGNDADGKTTGKALIVDSVGVIYVTGSSTGVEGHFLPGAVISDREPIALVMNPPPGVTNTFFAEITPDGDYLLEASLAGSYGTDQANGLAISPPLSTAGVVSIVGTTTPAPNNILGDNKPELFFNAGNSVFDSVNPDSPNKSAVGDTTGFMVQEALAGFCYMKRTAQAGTVLTFSGPCISGTQSGILYAIPASATSTGTPFSAPIAVTTSGGVLTALVTVDVASLGGTAAKFTSAFLPLGAVAGVGQCSNNVLTLNGCPIITAGGGAGTLFNVTFGDVKASLNCTTGCSGTDNTVAVGQQVTLQATITNALPETFTWASSSGMFTGTNPATSIIFTPTGNGGKVLVLATPVANPALPAANISLNTTGSASSGQVAILSNISKIVADFTYQFKANQAVTWRSSAGTIDANGVFVAPDSTPATVTITATAQSNTSLSATTQVSVYPRPILTVPTSTKLPFGGSVTVPVSVQAGTGISGEPLLLACTPSSLPTGVSCAFDLNPYPNDGSSSGALLTLSSTPVGSASLPRPLEPFSLGNSFVVFAAAILWRRRRLGGARHGVLGAASALCCFALLVGCGTGGSFNKASQQGHLPGSYNLTIVATGQGLADLGLTVAKVTLPITVQ